MMISSMVIIVGTTMTMINTLCVLWSGEGAVVETPEVVAIVDMWVGTGDMVSVNNVAVILTLEVTTESELIEVVVEEISIVIAMECN